MSRFRKPPNDIFVSTDIEADGPAPGLNSMLSLGSAAYALDGELLDTFSINLETLPGASAHPKTEEWWKQFPEAWEMARRDARPPAEAMAAYLEWLKGLDGRPVFVAWPVGFDFPFVNYYLMRFTGEAPFGFTALDIKTYAMALTSRSSYHRTTKDRLPDRWFEPGLKHNHVALDDALEQGALFMAMLREVMDTASDGVNLADYTEFPDW